MLRDLLVGLRDLLVPPICASCLRPTDGAALCARCDVHATQALPDAPPPRRIARWAAAVAYDGEAEKWVRRFKYPERGLRSLDPGADAVAAWWILRAGARLGVAPDLVVPVPLHPRRLRERGFNPAGALARALARAHGCAFDPLALARIRDTPSQTGLGKHARRKNLSGAFRAARELPPRIWLVDDVATTGSTLAEAARAARRAGAREIAAACLAWRPLLRD